MDKEKYIGCKSWLCHQCKHYVKFLTVSTMQSICWNKGCFYEEGCHTGQLKAEDVLEE